MAKQPYHITPLGDAALLVQFGNSIDDALHKKVLQLFRTLKALQPPYIVDVVPAYASLAVYYDAYGIMQQKKLISPFAYVSNQVAQLLDVANNTEAPEHRKLEIPVCYAAAYAPDIAEVAAQKNLSVPDVIRLHTTTKYTVYMIGFLPGFAYMGTVDSRIAVPRRAEPRGQVAAGAVGIAGVQTGIYPMASPGGWQVIGRTPVSLFQPWAAQPVLLQPGDVVQFYSITEDEFTNYRGGPVGYSTG